MPVQRRPGAGGERAIQREVTIEKKGTALADGTAFIRVEIACVGPVLEAFVALSQQDGAASGDGPVHPSCDGASRTYDVAVTPFDGRFQEGKAFASAFVLLCDPTGTTSQTGRILAS